MGSEWRSTISHIVSVYCRVQAYKMFNFVHVAISDVERNKK
jgi:hypothetical protein